MRIIFFFIVLIILNAGCMAQSMRKSQNYIQVEVAPTLADRTIKQNPWLAGLGMQKIFGSGNPLHLNLEITGSIYPAHDKVYRTNPDGSELKTVTLVIGLYGGVSGKITKSGYLSGVLGPGYVNGRVLLSTKPSLSWFWGKRTRVFTRISYIQLFNREEYSKQNYKALSVSFGIKLN